MEYYFVPDGSYGLAFNLVIFNTSNWTEEDWQKIDEADDDERYKIATQINTRYILINQQS